MDSLRVDGEIEVAAGRAGSEARLLSADRARALEERLLARLAAFEEANRLRPGMPVEELREHAGVPAGVADSVLARLETEGRIRRDRDTVATAGRTIRLTETEQGVLDGLADLIEEGGLAPPTLSEACRSLAAAPPLVEMMRRLLVHEGRAVAVTPDLSFAAGALRSLKQAVHEQRESSPEISVAWFKERFGLSRKHAIPLLEWLDRERVTIRVGDVRRIRRPSAPSPAEAPAASVAETADAAPGVPAA